MHHTLAVGTVTYNNSPAQIFQFLKSLDLCAAVLARQHVELHLYFIDNGVPSEIETVAGANNFQSFTINHIASRGNIGFAGATNLLMASAFTSDCHRFVTVNPDGVPAPDCLSLMLSKANENSDCLIEARQFPDEHPKWYDPETGRTSWASGACLLIPAKIYEKLHGFDPSFFMFMEDVDLSWRARSEGFQIVVCDRALFGHPVVGRNKSEYTDEMMFRSALYLSQKWDDQSFQQWLKAEIINRGIMTESDLSALTAANQLRLSSQEWQQWRAPQAKASDSPVDFNHYFYFAHNRW